MLAAAVGMVAACQKTELVTFNPEDVVAPVLHSVEDIVVTVDNKSESVVFSWDAADFGVKTQVYYSLDMAKDGKSVNLFSGISGNSASVSLDNLNNKAYNDLGIASGEAGEVTFTLGAKLNVGATYYAEPVTGKVTPTAAEKVYPNVWVIGNYCGWAHDKSLYLWNFAEDDDVFMGIVDFGAGDEKTGGFKITPAANWDAEFGGTGLADAEPSSIPVVTSGGSDIKNYTAKRFYHFSLSTKALTLTKNLSFDQVGVIGLNGNWETDIVMNYSNYKQRFYVDVEVAADTEFKFRMDGAWDYNLGGDVKALTNGGGNIAIAPGNYRIYLDMNNFGAMSCTLDEKMYGKEEPTGSDSGSDDGSDDGEVVTNEGWGLVGTINGWGGDGPDVDMKVGNGWLVAAGVELPEGAEVKFRLDGGWDVNFGGAFSVNSIVTLAAGGDNMKTVEGTYDIYLDADGAKAYFMTDGKTPADAGQAEVTYIDASTVLVGFSGKFAGVEKWVDPADGLKAAFVKKTLTDEAKYAGTYEFKVENLAIAANDEFKLRVNGDWIGVGGATVEGLAVTGSDNFIAGETGTYTATITFEWDGLKASASKIVFSK